MTTFAKDMARVKELRDRPRSLPQHYDAERLDQLRHKYAAGSDSRFLDWRDAAADDAGVARFGPI